MFKLFFVLTVCSVGVLGELNDVFEWKELSFVWPDEATKNNALKNGDYIPENNLPLGLARWKDKLFITVPRWKAGVVASLNYIPLNTTEKSPALIPYPDFKSNQIPKDKKEITDKQIVSTFRLYVDVCDRLWVMETGLADILGNPEQIIPPSITIFDLNTDKLIRRYNLGDQDIKDDSFFANIIVDVTKDSCDKAFAYIPDLGGYGVVVYSFADNRSWRIQHNYFHFDPLKGDMTVGGVNFQWTDGIFGIALGPVNENGFRTAYFHPLASCHEFSVSTQVWRNESLATDPHSYNLYKIEGVKGDKAQTSSSIFDEKSNVLVMTQLQRDGIGCWNPRKPLDVGTFALPIQDHERLIFTNDLKIDADRNLWILSDKMPVFIYRQLDSNQVNYRVMKTTVDETIKGTACEA